MLNMAILLHMKVLTAYTFDRVAFVDLGRRGVRDLSSDATSIWVIAGPPEDRLEPFELRRFPKSALSEAQVIRPNANGKSAMTNLTKILQEAVGQSSTADRKELLNFVRAKSAEFEAVPGAPAVEAILVAAVSLDRSHSPVGRISAA
ncbi:MAG: hypothetical protein ACREYF_05290 [Gammaproteobacteria bacterium]